MNRHYDDAAYHLRLAATHLRAGTEDEASRMKHRVDRMLGREPTPTTQLDGVRDRLVYVRRRIKRQIDSLRQRLSIAGSRAWRIG